MSNLLAMTVTGSGVFLLMLLLRPATARVFSASWQYRMAKMGIVFFLFPVSLLVSKLASVLPQPTIQNQHSGMPPLLAPVAGHQNGLLDAIHTMDAAVKEHLTMEVIQVASSIWLLGAICFAAWHLYCYCRFMKSLQASSMEAPEDANAMLSSCKAALNIHADVKLMQNPTISSPMLVGLRRPMILLPTLSMRENDLRLVLNHELTHLKHRDLWVKLLALMASTLHWFNPFVHMLRKEIGTWGELACDEALACNMTHGERTLYGEAILNTLDTPSGINTAFCSSFCESKKHLKRRLIMLLNVKKASKITTVFAVVTLLTIGCTATAFAVSANASTIGRSSFDALDKAVASVASQKQGNAIIAEKITDFSSGEYSFDGNAAGISFGSFRGSTDDTLIDGFTADPNAPSFPSQKGAPDSVPKVGDFDVEKAIADIEAGRIKPLSKDNLPEGASDNSTFTLTDKDGSKIDIILE